MPESPINRPSAPQESPQNPAVFQFRLKTLFAVVALLSIPVAREAKRYNDVRIAQRQTADLERSFVGMDMVARDLSDNPTCATIEAQDDSTFWHLLSDADRCSAIEHLSLEGVSPSAGTLKAIAELPRLRFLQIRNGGSLTPRDMAVLSESASLRRISIFPEPATIAEMRTALPHWILVNDWKGEMREYNMLTDGNTHFNAKP